jgi:hypothetical protein
MIAMARLFKLRIQLPDRDVTENDLHSKARLRSIKRQTLQIHNKEFQNTKHMLRWQNVNEPRLTRSGRRGISAPFLSSACLGKPNHFFPGVSDSAP